MTTIALDKKQKKIMDEVTSISCCSKIYCYLCKSKFDYEYINILDRVIGLNDKILSDWLNISTRTYRNYKTKDNIILKDNIKEHIILILSLYKHGEDVFGSIANFEKWLTQKNVLLEDRKSVV